jgi:hypothetical protein
MRKQFTFRVIDGAYEVIFVPTDSLEEQKTWLKATLTNGHAEGGTVETWASDGTMIRHKILTPGQLADRARTAAELKEAERKERELTATVHRLRHSEFIEHEAALRRAAESDLAANSLEAPVHVLQMSAAKSSRKR